MRLHDYRNQMVYNGHEIRNAPLETPSPVVLFSGGIDSTVLLHRAFAAHESVGAVTVNYGQTHGREVLAARDLCHGLVAWHLEIQLPELGLLLGNSCLINPDVPVPVLPYGVDKTMVPNRNMILLSLAIGVAVVRGAHIVYYGVHTGDHGVYADCRPGFLKGMKHATQEAYGICLHAPFMTCSKAQIIQYAEQRGFPIDWARTWTCYAGGEQHCGECSACTGRREAFAAAGVIDPTDYVTGER